MSERVFERANHRHGAFLSPADRPFVDRPLGDLAAARMLAERTATELGLTAPTTLSVGMNAVFECGDVILRVSRPNAWPAAAYDLADVLKAAGVRVPRPADGRPVVVGNDELSDSPLVATAWERVVATGEVCDWTSVGAMVRLVRELPASAVPSAYPVPPCTVYPWWQFDDLLPAVAGEIDATAFHGLHDAVERHRRWVDDSGGPARWVLCHGDVHPGNVIVAADGPVIIDWDLLCLGPPAWDHAPLLSMVRRWGVSRDAYDALARGYGADLSLDSWTEAVTTLRLVAATILRVIAGRDDPAARAEAEHRLRYWRGDPDAPTWAMS